MFSRLREDIRTVFAKDPAARSTLEVLLCYPGLHALVLHRVEHWLWGRKLRVLARFLSSVTRWLTGIEIHPGATIGRRFFIDHGAGVVIGETAEIGDDVLMYQGVVLGGTSMDKVKRHPTIGNHVVLGAKAILLGAIEIGDEARVGAGSVVVKPVPPHCTVVGIPGRIVRDGSGPVPELDHARLPDPVAELIRNILSHQQRTENRVKELEQMLGIGSPEEPGSDFIDNFDGGEGI